MCVSFSLPALQITEITSDLSHVHEQFHSETAPLPSTLKILLVQMGVKLSALYNIN